MVKWEHKSVARLATLKRQAQAGHVGVPQQHFDEVRCFTMTEVPLPKYHEKQQSIIKNSRIFYNSFYVFAFENKKTIITVWSKA